MFITYITFIHLLHIDKFVIHKKPLIAAFIILINTKTILLTLNKMFKNTINVNFFFFFKKREKFNLLFIY